MIFFAWVKRKEGLCFDRPSHNYGLINDWFTSSQDCVETLTGDFSPSFTSLPSIILPDYLPFDYSNAVNQAPSTSVRHSVFLRVNSDEECQLPWSLGTSPLPSICIMDKKDLGCSPAKLTSRSCCLKILIAFITEMLQKPSLAFPSCLTVDFEEYIFSVCTFL